MDEFYRLLRSSAVTVLLAAAFLPGVEASAQQATLLGQWSDDELIGSSIFNNIYNEIWGVEVNGVEYAVIGSTAGTHFISLADPSNPVEVQFVPGAVMGANIIHRDFDDYNGYLYAVADEGESTLQIIDITGLPDAAPVVYDSPALIRRTHNIFIEDEHARMYAFHSRGTMANYQPMRIFDISDPEDPQILAGHGAFGGFTIDHVHDGYVRNNIAFLNCGGSGFYIVDLNDPVNPVMLSRLVSYPHQGYNHSGWLSDDGDHYYMADETHGADLKVLDVADPCNAEVVDTFNAGVDNLFAITHNQIVACDYLYTSYYYDGLQVFDISDREHPEKVLSYDTYDGPDGQSYMGAWGIYPLLPSGLILVSDMQTGLYVFEGVGDNCHAVKELLPIDDPCDPQVPTGLPEGAYLTGIYPQPASSGQTLHVALKDGLRGELVLQLVGIGGREAGRWLHDLDHTSNLLLDLPVDIPAGTYILHLSYGQEAWNTKIAIID